MRVLIVLLLIGPQHCELFLIVSSLINNYYCYSIELVWGPVKRRLTTRIVRMERGPELDGLKHRENLKPLVDEACRGYSNAIDCQRVANHVLKRIRRVLEGELL